MLTITEMKARNAAAGYYWFSRGNMRLFKTKIETRPTKDGYFITSDQPGNTDRRFSIQLFDLSTSDVYTIGAFQEFATLADAKAALKTLLKAKRCA
ncbi:DUF7447 family protein [Shouchella lonarensis]|uniref:Uncharacterized protein n=1 Tax=Shouchella lonarensis TaxID=1464122 RepID=A0A1G6HMW6_9BACI|nr:hypothetical protein [Shouchella lonarensis]SDB95235.1 hypothetical protein SAMN05421737_10469 [Shouchella lonarensis]